MQSEPLLELHEINRRYGGVVAVKDVTLDLRTGEICGLLGPNGAGKTTLVNLISGFTTPSSGRIRYRGKDIGRVGHTTRSRMGLVRTFQHARSFATMTVRESMSVAGTVPADHHRWFGLRGLTSIGTSDRTAHDLESLLERFGLTGWSDHPVASLPYGVKKTLGIAMAMMMEPQLLMLDEPAAGLNTSETTRLQGLVEDIRDLGVTVIVIEHNVPFILEICDRVAVMDNGELIAHAPPDEVMRDERVIGAYLGAA